MKVVDNTVKCECGFVVFDGLVLRIRVGLFSEGRMVLKCPRCKRFEDSLPVEILLKGGKNERTHNEYP